MRSSAFARQPGLSKFVKLRTVYHSSKVDVDMPDAVKSVLADVSSVSPWLRQSKGERKVDVDMLDAVKSVLAAQSSTLH